jgi:NADH-quinone oxidoreductase subunit A
MDYIPVLILLGIGAAVGLGGLTVSSLLGPKVRNWKKDSPFECGMLPVGDARRRFSVRFYLIAILFLLFDVETIFFFPFALVFREYLAINSFILWSMGLFLALLLIGFFYEWRKGALEWD